MKKIATILTTVLLMTVLLTMMTVSVSAAEAEPTQTGESVVAIEEPKQTRMTFSP